MKINNKHFKLFSKRIPLVFKFFCAGDLLLSVVFSGYTHIHTHTLCITKTLLITFNQSRKHTHTHVLEI